MENDRFKEKNDVNIICLIGVVLLAKLVYSVFKSYDVNNEQNHNESNNEEDKIDNKSSIEKPKELGRNKWLHSADNFGKLENGKVF